MSAERILSAEVTLLYFSGEREEEEKRRRNKEKKKQNEKDSQRKWHIFDLTGWFCFYFTQQDLPVKQT